MQFDMTPIAVVSGSRPDAKDDFWGDAVACITLDDRFPAEALQGLDTFSHAEILFVFNRVAAEKLVAGARHPRNNPDWPLTGIFAQRGKNRPNRIGSTICRIIRVDGRQLFVAELDALDGTPVLDIKPVMREFLPRGDVRQPSWATALMTQYWSKP